MALIEIFYLQFMHRIRRYTEGQKGHSVVQRVALFYAKFMQYLAKQPASTGCTACLLAVLLINSGQHAYNAICART